MNIAANSFFFSFESNKVAYRVYGKGPITLLALHGFGQTSQVFGPLEKKLHNAYTILAIDLFFHGQSSYAQSELLTKSDWQRLIGAFLQEKGITRLSLMGFSMGGRFALALTETLANRLDQLILLAPDGITKSNWYVVATSTRLGRLLFRYVMDHLSILEAGGKALTKANLLNRTVMRMVERTLTTPARRHQVYEVWTQFRRITPDVIDVSRALNEHNVAVLIFTGVFDRLVPGHFVAPLTNRLRRYELTGLKTGHNHLIELAGDALAQRFPDNLPEASD